MNSSRNRPCEQELPCVWSLAGVLGMRPCDRGYDCDSCELYHALSGSRPPGEDQRVRVPNLSQKERDIETEVGRIVSAVMHGCRLDLDRWYGADGVWVAQVDQGLLDVGLVGCVWKVLEPIREIVAPRRGLAFESADTCGWLVRSDRAIPLRSPVGGTVAEVNDALVGVAHRSGRVDGADSWLFRMESNIDPAGLPTLFRGENTLVWHLRKLRVLKGHLHDALESGAVSIGPVMADGGVVQANLETLLGPDRFAALIDSLF